MKRVEKVFRFFYINKPGDLDGLCVDEAVVEEEEPPRLAGPVADALHQLALLEERPVVAGKVLFGRGKIIVFIYLFVCE